MVLALQRGSFVARAVNDAVAIVVAERDERSKREDDIVEDCRGRRRCALSGSVRYHGDKYSYM